MTHPVLKHAEDMMKKALEATTHDFQRIRTGRANPQALEVIKVDYYGVETPIPQVGSVGVPEPRQLLITPYDKSLIPEIEKAIMNSDLGVTLRCIPHDPELAGEPGTCPFTGDDSPQRVVWAKSY